jgi:hypothetical protein
MFVDLVHKNLLRLRPKEKEEQIMAVWEKEVRVVKDIKQKIEKRIELTSPRSRGTTGRFLFERALECELNPEGEW